MKISCNIIRDLLPLYAEDLASEDTRLLVEEHLCDCETCSRELESVKKKPEIPADSTTESLDKVKKLIRRRRAISVLAAVLTLLTLAMAVFTYLFTPFQLTLEQALDDFYVREDGAIVIDYSPYVTGRSQSGYNQNWFINQYSTRFDVILGKNRADLWSLYGTDGVVTEDERQRYENIEIIYGRFESADGKIHSDGPIPGEENGGTLVELESEKNWWYFDPNGLGKDTLLHDAGEEYPPREDRIQFAPIYPILFFGGILAVMALLVLRKSAKRPGVKELETRLLILAGSTVLSTLFVSNGRIFTAYVGVINAYWGSLIPANTVLLTLTTLFWRQLYLLNRQDKCL